MEDARVRFLFTSWVVSENERVTIIVNLTRVFRKPIQLQCTLVKLEQLKHQFLFQNQIFKEVTQEIKRHFVLSQLL